MQTRYLGQCLMQTGEGNTSMNVSFCCTLFLPRAWHTLTFYPCKTLTPSDSVPQCPRWCTTLVRMHQGDMFRFSEAGGKAISICPLSETRWTPSKGKRTNLCVENHTEAQKNQVDLHTLTQRTHATGKTHRLQFYLCTQENAKHSRGQVHNIHGYSQGGDGDQMEGHRSHKLHHDGSSF